ncbi:MAG: DNA internalization-related competence protein ComEC/Rec2 [Nitrospirota bacterium]
MLFFISFLSGVILFYLFDYFPFSTAAVFICISTFLTLRRKALLILLVALGIFYAFVRISPANDPSDAWKKELRVTGRFAPEAGQLKNNTNIRTFAVDRAFDEESGEEIEELSDEEIGVFTDYDADPSEEYELVIQTGSDRSRLNPGSIKGGRLFGSVIASSKGHDVADTIPGAFRRYRAAINNHVSERFKQDSAGLISAVTTGERSYLGEDIMDAFNITGLAHILSISGTHFGLFSIMLFGFFNIVIKRLPYSILQRLTIYMTPSQASAVLCLPFMAMYLGLSGGSVPAVRSFIMISLFLAGLLVGRKGLWLNSLLLAAFILVIWDPDVILSLSFQLSFIAVIFIGFSVKKKDAGEKEEGNRILNAVKNIIRLTVAASAGTAPLVAYHFHYFSVIAPISNLIIAPLIGFILIPLSLISSFSFLITGRYIFAPFVGISADLSVALVKFVSGIPFADVKIPAFPIYLCILFYTCFLLYLIFGKSRKLLVIPFVPFMIYAVFHIFEKKELSVTFLDVGQGDSSVIELPDKKTLVIDTGRTGKETAAFLKYIGKKDIDALVLSHVHPDHSGGIEYILKKFDVKEIWDNGRIEYPQVLGISGRHRILERGDVIGQGLYQITVLHPYREFYTLSSEEYDEENNSSLVLKISGEKISFLFSGDVEEEAETDIAHLQKWLDSDVIKIPHHGGRTSAGETFLSDVSPSIAVISVGRENPFGHPSPDVIGRLTGAKVYRTDIDGAVKITGTEKGFSAGTFRDYMFEKANGFEKELKNLKRLFIKW